MKMEVFGKYYRTRIRDQATARTEFDLSYMRGDCRECCKDGLLRCNGHISVIGSGIPVKLTGEYKNGIFWVESYSFLNKEEYSAREMLRFLTDDELTEHQEMQIVKKCNNDLLLLLKDKSIVNTVLLKSKKRRDVQKKLYKKLFVLCEQEQLTNCLLQYGVDLNKIELLLEQDVTFENFQNNPYLLSLFHSMTVYQADQFAYEFLKILPYDKKRLCGFVMDSVLLYKKAGHSCVPMTALLKCVNRRLSKSIYPDEPINMVLLYYCINELKKYLEVHIINEIPYVYEKEIWEEETEIVIHLQRLNREKRTWVENINLSDIEEKLGITYNNGQKAAFELVKTSGVKILTGPPGSGKTAIIKGLVLALEQAYPNASIRLSATTGRAAQVMSFSSKKEAETVNKMLNICPYGDKLLGKNQNNPIEADFIIVDEVSMLGTKLASCLFSAIKTGSILLLVGDENQLQSVEYGNILQDLIRSKALDVYRLTEIMRQGGSISENAVKINKGKKNLVEDDKFRVYRCTEENAKEFLFSKLQKENVQILSSVKEGPLGTRRLNREIQEQKHTDRNVCLFYRNQPFYEQDSIIVTETNYDKGYFNGDIGTIIGSDEHGLIVKFNTKILHLDKSDFHVMELAYAITTHKSQGSEFQHIHIVLPRNPGNMLTRRILYTAITRAKADVSIYSIDSAMEYAISNEAEQQRISLLHVRLSNMP